jgi:glutaredoxin
MFEPPAESGYTVYSKSGCVNCEKAKRMIEDKLLMTWSQGLALPLKYINCDDYLIEDRTGFLSNLKLFAGCDVKYFPMIFFDGEYIGSYNALAIHLECN